MKTNQTQATARILTAAELFLKQSNFYEVEDSSSPRIKRAFYQLHAGAPNTNMV